MYSLTEQSERFEGLNAKSKALAAEVLAAALIPTEKLRIQGGTDVLTLPQCLGKLLVLREGHLSAQCEAQPLFFYDEGDVVGFDRFFGEGVTQVVSDFAIVADLVNMHDLWLRISTEPALLQKWQEYICVRLELFQIVMAQLIKRETIREPTIRNFHADDCIMQQGQMAEEIFTLVEGNADIVIDGETVAYLETEDVFGVVSALTMMPSPASVVARSHCLVLSLNKDHFIDLIQGRPATIHRLIEDFASVIARTTSRLSPSDRIIRV